MAKKEFQKRSIIHEELDEHNQNEFIQIQKQESTKAQKHTTQSFCRLNITISKDNLRKLKRLKAEEDKSLKDIVSDAIELYLMKK